MGVSFWFRWMPFLQLLNVWTPLRPSPIRPLVLMDRRTAQLIYRHRNGNDILLAGAHPAQRYYFAPTVAPGRAFVFFTGKTPHASASVPGEECLGRNGPCPAATAELRALLLRNKSSEWTRESVEMRCAMLVVDERWLWGAMAALTSVWIIKALTSRLH